MENTFKSIMVFITSWFMSRNLWTLEFLYLFEGRDELTINFLLMRLSHSPDRQKVFIIIKWLIPFYSKVTLNSSLIMEQRKNKRNIVTTPNQSLNAVMILAKHIQEQIQFLPSPIFLSDKYQILSQTQFNFCKLLKFNSNILFVVQANCSYSFAG